MPRSTSKKKQNISGNSLNLRQISKNIHRSNDVLDDFSKQVIRSFTQYLTAKKLNDKNGNDERSLLKIKELKAWIKKESTTPDKAQRIVDIGASLVINTKLKPKVFRKVLDDFGLPQPSLFLGEQEILDVNTDSTVSLKEQHSTEREEMLGKGQTKRAYRHATERPDPNKGGDAAINRNDAVIQIRASKEFKGDFAKYCKKSPEKAKDIGYKAISEYMTRNPV